ncbi:hypothetical protein PHMEG_00010415 [Phytophthora megakarya]|uniref:Uncharacterized protein n=1 Tax=Phytophthora megakarya TaxID=4795 RepID=A0A225WFT4_9STRA|nr:hypothetical protein PHMEG_00010415 [Phytophthora megakarya]
MVDYARVVHPLQAKVDGVMSRRGRRKRQLTGVDLEWPDDDVAAFTSVVDPLSTSNNQHFVDKDT